VIYNISEVKLKLAMKITEITRRDIVDEMMRQHIDWWFGRLEEIAFLKRYYYLG